MKGKSYGILLVILIGVLLLPSLALAQTGPISPYGIVNASRLNLRSGDDIKFESLGILRGGTRLEVLGRNIDSSWYLVSDGELSGWVHSKYVVLRGMSARGYPIMARASAAPLAPNAAIVNTAFLNLRAGAGVHYPVNRIVPGGTSGNLIGRNADWSWIFVELDDGTEGWLNTSYVILRGATLSSTIELLENGEFTSAHHGIVNTSYLNMRSGGGVEYMVQEILPGGTILDVLGRNDPGSWLYVRVNGREGWLHSGYVILRGKGVDAYPLMLTAQDAPIAPTIAIVNTPFLNLRSGDHYSNEVIDVLAGGSELNVLASSASGRWFMVETSDGQIGWVSAAFVILRGPRPPTVSLG